MNRYRVGMEKGISCDYLEQCPAGSVPVSDYGTAFAFGVVIAVCPGKVEAELVATALNTIESIRKLVKS
jgi:hypothetical protein